MPLFPALKRWFEAAAPVANEFGVTMDILISRALADDAQILAYDGEAFVPRIWVDTFRAERRKAEALRAHAAPDPEALSAVPAVLAPHLVSAGKTAQKLGVGLDWIIEIATQRGIGMMWVDGQVLIDRKWADDRGGFVPYEEPEELVAAYRALAQRAKDGGA